MSVFDSIVESVLRNESISEREGNPVNIDELAIEHARRTGKYRELVYTECPECRNRYPNLKYMKFLLYNTEYPLDIDIATKLMNYQGKFGDCCEKLLDNLPDLIMEQDSVNKAELMIHYYMARGMEINTELLDRLGINQDILDVYRKSYRTPPLDQESARIFNDWANSTESIESLNFRLINDESKDLQIDRHCRQLEFCTSCGTRNTYAYLYWFLSILGVNREEIFLDFQVIRPCCRSTYQSPIMKPIEYEHERMSQVFRGTRIIRPSPIQSVVKLPSAVPKVIPKTIPKSVPKSIPKTIPKSVPKSIPKAVPKVLAPKKAPAKIQLRR